MILLFIIIGVLTILYGLAGFVYNKWTTYINQENPDKPSKRPHFKYTTLSMIVGLVWVIIWSLLVKIGAQEVAVVVTPKGVRDTEFHTGWHFVSPFNDVYRMDKTVWVYSFTTKRDESNKNGDDAIWVPTKDGIKMGFDLSTSWRIDPDYASWIYSNVSENDDRKTGRYYWLEDNVIRAKTKSSLALAVSQFTPIEAYSNKREDIRNLTFKMLSQELKTYHLILDQIDLREVFYNGDYEKAINAKKLAEQEVLRLVEVTKQKTEQLKQAEIDKNMAIQMAEGEAKALQIKGSSIASNPRIIELEWIDKWDGALPQYMMGNGQGVILNLPNQNQSQK